MNQEQLAKIKQKALEDHIPIIMDDTLEYIATLLRKKQPTSFLEIGTAVGYSAICFSEYLAINGVIDTIEKEKERYQEAVENIRNMDLQDKIHVLLADAVEILPTIEKKYDIVFIDAAKGKYPFFFKEAMRLLKPDGMILADNVLYKGYVLGDYNKHKQRTAVTHLREYLKLVQEEPSLETQILEIGDGLAVSTKK